VSEKTWLAVLDSKYAAQAAMSPVGAFPPSCSRAKSAATRVSFAWTVGDGLRLLPFRTN
jgi:hypothetical protein